MKLVSRLRLSSSSAELLSHELRGSFRKSCCHTSVFFGFTCRQAHIFNVILDPSIHSGLRGTALPDVSR